MNLSQKCQYAVRAVLELAKQYGHGPVAISQIAANQAIPQRFLENILNEMKPTGLIESRRGIQGGYLLTKDPSAITVGEVIRLVEGPLDPVKCLGDRDSPCCPLKESCALINLWSRAKATVEEIYNGTSFRDLIEEERTLQRAGTIDYSI
ncbi:MAG TPA: RrF2 family transcriptional regulator [Sedimentisphaerales bacterium]|nr:RrF2 family transcriptional regulator [Sedimentisphaerales bacterium]HNU29184.1 RrF2 family transcriptional regulator [Sedimentisphaerales bacterium]